MSEAPLDSLRSSGVELLTPADAAFSSVSDSYTGPGPSAAAAAAASSSSSSGPPSAIALPSSPAQVQSVVAACLAASHPLTVRGGGHDAHRRFVRPGALLLDLRRLTRLDVHRPDRATATATVGAGLTSEQLLAGLEPLGLQAVTGTGAAVGFAGWSIGGGYGPLDARYGIGAHQIVGATLVNGEGRLVEADERLLKAVRGGAGFFGVVVELTVNVYPLDGIQSGVFLFESSDLQQTVTTVLTAYDKLAAEHAPLPRSLCVLPVIMPFPGAGVVLALSFLWSGPASDASRAWAERIGALAPRLPGPPLQPTSMLGVLRNLARLIRPRVRGTTHSVSLTRLSPQAVRVLASQAARIPPAGNGGFSLHIVRPDSPACAGPESVTPYGTPHVSVDVLGIVDIDGEEEVEREMVEWAQKARDELVEVDAAAKFTYLPFTHPKHLSLEGIYGENLEFMRQIKKEQDPNNVFKHGLVRL